jgi:methionyl-tRNA synthetase
VEEALDPDGHTREVLTGAYITDATWVPSTLSPGQQLRQPEPLFTKLDDRVAEEELARLHASAEPRA